MKKVLLLFTLLSLFSCSKKEASPNQKQTDAEEIIEEQPEYIELTSSTLEGDFDGDGIKEKLVTFISDSTGKAVKRLPAGKEWGDTIDYTFKNGITTKLYIEGRAADTIKLGTSTGLYCLINIGDLNKDKKDEIIFVADWPDYSNLNSARVYTLCNNKWIEIKTFSINEGIAFYWEGEIRPTFKDIPGFLINNNGKWIYSDYEDEDYDGHIEHMKKLEIPKCH